MADTKITALTAISTNPVNPATFPIPMVDLLDTSMAASGTTKKVTVNQILGAGGTATLASATITGAATVGTTLGVTGASTLASATITGDLTVDTSTLKVTASTDTVTVGATTTDSKFRVLDANYNGLRIGFLPGTANYNLYDATVHEFRTANVTPQQLYTFQASSAVWYDGAGGTRMTLNSTGLGIGVAPTDKLTLQSATDCALSLAKTSGTNKLYIITDGTTGWLASTAGATGKKIAYSLTCPDDSLTLDASGNLFIKKTASALGTVGIENAVAGYIQSTVTSDASLFCNRLATDGETIKFYRQTLQVGNIAVTTLATTYNSISDYRLKEAVQPLVGGLARVSALKPSIYKWKVNGSDGEGFLAHELASVVSAAVTGEKDAVNEDGSINAQSIDMSRIVPILVAAIQELTAEVNALKNA